MKGKIMSQNLVKTETVSIAMNASSRFARSRINGGPTTFLATKMKIRRSPSNGAPKETSLR